MSDTRIDNLRAQIGGPRDGSLLRFALGGALLEADMTDDAVAAFRAALEFEPGYSAAWKLLGKAELARGNREAAADAWREGIAAAIAHGDQQAQKEMQVFLRRLRKE